MMHPILRCMPTCPLCLEPKDQGRLICWPCHKTQTAHNRGGYSEHAVARVATIATFLDVAFEMNQRAQP